MGSTSPFSREFIYFGKVFIPSPSSSKTGPGGETFLGGRAHSLGRYRLPSAFSSLCWEKVVEWDTHVDMVDELVTRKLSLQLSKSRNLQWACLPCSPLPKGNAADSSTACRGNKGDVGPVQGLAARSQWASNTIPLSGSLAGVPLDLRLSGTQGLGRPISPILIDRASGSPPTESLVPR